MPLPFNRNTHENDEGERLNKVDLKIYINWLKDTYDSILCRYPEGEDAAERFYEMISISPKPEETNDPGPRLKPQQIKAVYWLAQGLTQNETALKIGVSRYTIINWNQLPEFREEVAALTRENAENEIHIVNNLRNRTLRALSDELLDGRTRGWAALNLLRMFGPEQMLGRATTPIPSAEQMYIFDESVIQTNDSTSE